MSASADRPIDLAWRPVHLPGMLLVCVAAGLALAGRAGSRSRAFGAEPPVVSQRMTAAEEKLDPDTASVASLRRLPGIGPVKARAIVALRERRRGRAFRTADDLMRVHGIGPNIARRIAPYLDLPRDAP